MDNRTIANEWFDIAKIDLDSAKYLCGMYPLPKEIICYHSQQSAGKMLKGYISLNGGKISKTHELIALNKICINYNSKFIELMDLCIDLVDYGVNVRYPYHIEISDEDVKLAIGNAEKTINFILGNI